MATVRQHPVNEVKAETTTIAQIFTEKGYDADKLTALAHLLHLTGGLDGRIKDGKPTQEEISVILEKETTTGELNGLFQKNYFQKFRGTGERQQIKPTDELAPHKDEIAGLFRALGYIDTVAPTKEKYDIAFVYGCAEEGLRGRIGSLKKLQSGNLLGEQKSAVEIDRVFILAGDRPLWPDRESTGVQIFAKSVGVNPQVIQAQVNEIFTPEVRARNDAAEITAKRTEAISVLESKYRNSGVSWPTEADMARKLARDILPDGQAIVVDAEGRDGKRPDTLDTVNAWNKTYGTLIRSGARAKSIVAISSQPFIPEQYVPLGVLPDNKFSFEVVGAGCDPEKVKPESLLAAFAGGFYKGIQLEQFKSQQKAQQEQLER